MTDTLYSATFLPTPVVLLLALLLAWAVLRAPWRALVRRQARQHAFFAALLLLPLLWLGSMRVAEGVEVHLLGMTAVCLVFGWQLALVLGAAAVLALGIGGHWPWASLPFHYLVAAAVPVVVTRALLAAADRLKRTNLFVYLLGVGFLGGVLSMVASLLLDARLQGWEADHAMVLLIAFPEGFIDGAVVTALTVFYPSIMRTYDDNRYLGEP
jgi:uncharacterized membrane protein